MKAKNALRNVSHLAGCIINSDRVYQYHLCSYCEDLKEKSVLSNETRLNSKNEELKSIIRNSIHADNSDSDPEIRKS